MSSAPSREPLRLMQYAPMWGAPSLDAECTRVQAWLRFCGLLAGRDYSLEDCGPASTGELPVLAAEGVGLVSGARIDACLCERGHDPDARLSAAQRAEGAAFSALVRYPLRLSLAYSWWGEAGNYSAVIRPAYAGSLPFPVGMYLPWIMRRRANSMLARQQSAEAEVAYVQGEEALRQLAARLGEAHYFFGDAPSSLDAAVFAYGTAILRCPLPHDRLRVSLKAHPNLVAFCERISADFFGASAPLLPPTAAPVASEGAAAAGRPSAGPLPAANKEVAAPSAASARTPKQLRFKRRARNALLGAAGSALLYMLSTDMLGGAEQAEESDEEE